MDHPLIDLISAKIREAEANGEFDDLEGAGKPLDLADAKADYLTRVMRENDAVPEFVTLQRRVAELREELPMLSVAERKEALKEIADLEPRIALAKQAWLR